MKNIKFFSTITAAFLLICCSNVYAFPHRQADTCASGEQIDQFLGAMQNMTTSWQDWSLQMSDDIGEMSDRIVTTEEMIGQMADRIVTTEALMARLTLMLAHLAAGQDVDPALLETIQNTVNNVCTQPPAL